MSKPLFRVGKTLGTTIYRGNENQPCAIVINGGDRHALAERIVDLLNTGQTSKEIEKRERILRSVCGEAYQFAGAAGAPERVLDNLSDAAHGKPLRHATVLPVSPDE